MYVPFISTRSDKRLQSLYRRKGGGGGGGKGGGGGGGGGGKSGSGGSGGKPSGSGAGRTSSISAGGSSKTATSFGSGGGKSAPIPAGQLFAGRSSGGGTRAQVFGNSQYGSGYPGIATRGVTGRGFPFVFWPLAWGGIGGLGAGAYLHSDEYGRPDNSSRPGGPLATAIFVSGSTNTTFRVLSDNTTIVSLIPDLTQACGGSFNNASTSTAPSPYNDSFSALPQPEQTIQYYRASTVALTLDGYNNTAVFEPEGTPNVPLPSNIDTNLLNCLNTTIGAAVPLVGGVPKLPIPHLGFFGVAWIIWLFFCTF